MNKCCLCLACFVRNRNYFMNIDFARREISKRLLGFLFGSEFMFVELLKLPWSELCFVEESPTFSDEKIWISTKQESKAFDVKFNFLEINCNCKTKGKYFLVNFENLRLKQLSKFHLNRLSKKTFRKFVQCSSRSCFVYCAGSDF